MPNSESRPLLPDNPNASIEQYPTVEKFKTGIRLVASIPEGAANWVSTFGLVAIYYHPGSWLIAPMALGAGISLSNEVVEALAKRYPENKFLKSLHKGTFFMDYAVGGFLGDFGFAWTMITTVAMDVGGVRLYSDSFGKIIAPALALIPTLISTRQEYYRVQGERNERSFSRHAASFWRGGTAFTGVLDVLIQQGQLALNSFIPTTIILFTAITGLCESLAREGYPVLSDSLIFLLAVLCVNPSLAAALFHFPLDIYAAAHDDEVTNDLFDWDLGGSSFLMGLLSAVALIDFQLQLAQRRQKEPSVRIEEIDAENDIESQELLTFSMSDFSDEDENTDSDMFEQQSDALEDQSDEYSYDADDDISQYSEEEQMTSEPLLEDESIEDISLEGLSIFDDNTASPLHQKEYNESIRIDYKQIKDVSEVNVSLQGKNRYPFFARHSLGTSSVVKQEHSDDLNHRSGYESS
ncbi:hypothetical protein Lqui_0264 [Legionella quinlivanii]|uniref:Transmembrane protein n=1 Tax=Legionella quinlivanii TaxID=45073 RepID=A0A0W0Y361_9GAMM|nr:hypothetical protein [Legionella quinlivanii]KTD51420.1 hypothetical protein Lqui_0264 [Legionella quinlivanii]SEG11258.1 hypothetical protein SAMN02746093_01911 [Legionella quinlivanii DSM 21216]STY10180.1 Uncharacterised protein [Legionella quinlivanii]